MYPNTLLFIDGAWCAAASGRTMPVMNPATGKQIGTLAHAEKPDLDRALEAASKGFNTWRKISAFERYKIMRKAADIFRARVETVGTCMTFEQGKPIGEPVDQRLAGEFRFDWFLENVPQRHVEIVERARRQEPARQLALFRQPQTEALGRQAQAELELRAGAGAHAGDDLVHDAGAIVGRATIVVGAPVGFRAEKGAENIAVCTVQLDAVEAGLLGAHRGGDEILDQRFDFALIKRAGLELGIVGRAARLLADQCGRRADSGRSLHRSASLAQRNQP